ncbi:hypothetical protein FF38_04032 [Lucilia cuprina]|uniref:Uncharacterized protein n=1 Tax=Lucilia cuprina TaxID=7375 RepID=A0A0L0BNU3_LUCCU|nr:hypothetical protein FF38_04032 [Lucilia cuprina]
MVRAFAKNSERVTFPYVHFDRNVGGNFVAQQTVAVGDSGTQHYHRGGRSWEQAYSLDVEGAASAVGNDVVVEAVDDGVHCYCYCEMVVVTVSVCENADDDGTVIGSSSKSSSSSSNSSVLSNVVARVDLVEMLPQGSLGTATACNFDIQSTGSGAVVHGTLATTSSFAMLSSGTREDDVGGKGVVASTSPATGILATMAFRTGFGVVTLVLGTSLPFLRLYERVPHEMSQLLFSLLLLLLLLFVLIQLMAPFCSPTASILMTQLFFIKTTSSSSSLAKDTQQKCGFYIKDTDMAVQTQASKQAGRNTFYGVLFYFSIVADGRGGSCNNDGKIEFHIIP